ncbi:MAG TPA: glycosyltransferase [Verrucomicrobiae bacterium]|nr:glycosyltransferase [Verrucomicrobiae bacterium]
MHVIFGSLATLSFILLMWQWIAARRFPLHQRVGDTSFAPAVTLLKSLKGADAATEDCLRSWFVQDYRGEMQILFGVATADDPVCAVVKKLQQEFPNRDVRLEIVSTLIGTNAKISKLAELEKLAKHDILVVSDADVRVPVDFLANAVVPLREGSVGLVNCFYRLANPSTLAMRWEAIAINADFWSQVLQSQTLKPLDFALGAVMLTRRALVAEIGGFKSLADCLADDYQLGNRIAKLGHRIVLSPIVVECWDPPMDARAVWRHQLRWARTIRVCQPVPYFFSILSNAGLWAIIWLFVGLTEIRFTPVDWHFDNHLLYGTSHTRIPSALVAGGCFILFRILIAQNLQSRLMRPFASGDYFWLVPIKDLLQGAIWLCAFIGNTIEWRGQAYRLRRDGTLVKAGDR